MPDWRSAREAPGDLFAKCAAFAQEVGASRRAGLYDRLYRVPLAGPLDARVRVTDPGGGERELICFDSNSYLGLHLDPRVLDAQRRALDEGGGGAPSAQVLGGTHRWLRALEDEVAALHGRSAALVFPSGYQANIAIVTALLGGGDRALIDVYAHRSLHDGAQYAGCAARAFLHGDLRGLERLLAKGPAGRTLVITDGVFSMHGDVVDLPALRALCDRYGAALMVDEAHSVGVFGASGGGLEEHFGRPGAIDVLMGTFSKAPGALGGYLVGDAAMCDYVRYFGNGALFTASLPPAVCAGLTTAIRLLRTDPEPRERLWANTRRLGGALEAYGLHEGPPSSPILTVSVGDEANIGPIAGRLFDAGLKVGFAQYPAVPRGQAALRLSVNARHTTDDLDRAAEAVRDALIDGGGEP